MSDVTITCPRCSQQLEVPEEMLGQAVDCPACNRPIQLPAPKKRVVVQKRKQIPKSPSSYNKTIPLGSSRPKPTAPGAPDEAGSPAVMNMLFGILGSLVLILGVFAPLVSVPIMGSMNYFQNGKGDGIVILALAGVALVLSLSRLYKALWLPFLGCAGMLTFTFVRFQQGMSEARTEMKAYLADNPFAGLAELAMESVQLQWGFAVLIVGTVMLLIAAGLPAKR